MSRQSHLPPRCPFQTKRTVFASSSNDRFNHGCQKSVSQSFLLDDEQPPWLEDILSETNENIKISPIRRSVSDSVAILGSNESGSGLESSCVYGPNSPRSRGDIALSENIVVSKLKDYFSHVPTLYSDSSLIESEVARPNMIRNGGGSAEMGNVETRTLKRHSGQRSRVRKLQHIAELERTVDVLQSLESELAIKVASLLQLRVALLLENNTLKQQISALGQDKVFLEGEYRSLKTELERLKNHLPYSVKRTYSTDFGTSSMKKEASLEDVWEMINVGKLDIN